jgi:hypothetical protein
VRLEVSSERNKGMGGRLLCEEVGDDSGYECCGWSGGRFRSGGLFLWSGTRWSNFNGRSGLFIWGGLRLLSTFEGDRRSENVIGPFAGGGLRRVIRRRRGLVGPLKVMVWERAGVALVQIQVALRPAMSNARWLGPIIIIHLLGLAPAGYLAAPDSGPEGHYTGWCIKYPKRETVVSLCH